MKKFLQKIYLKISTYFLIRKLKKFGYKFLFLFFIFFISTYQVRAYDLTSCYSSHADYYKIQSPGINDFWGTGYLLNANSFTVIPADSSYNTLHLPVDTTYNSVINFYFEFSYESYYSYPIVVNLQVYNGSNWINATCDGELLSYPVSSDYDSINNRYEVEYYWNCGQLDLTQVFTQFRFVVSGISGYNPMFTFVSVWNVSYSYTCDTLHVENYLDVISATLKSSNDIISKLSDNVDSANLEFDQKTWFDMLRTHLKEDDIISKYDYDDLDIDDLSLERNTHAISFLYDNVNTLVTHFLDYKAFILAVLSIGIVGLIYARRGHL